MPALAAVKRPDPSAFVPAEWRGRARALRSRVADAHQQWEAAAMALTTPLCQRDGFTPIFTRQSLSVTAARWRSLPQAWGRLRLVARNDGGTLSIAEIRLVDFRSRMAGWREDELGVAIAVFAVTMAQPSAFTVESKIVALAGLHALARRYERGERTDLGVARDLLALALTAPGILARGGEFAVDGREGRWIGARMALDGQSVAAARTYVT
jgi:hypothetical protein